MQLSVIGGKTSEWGARGKSSDYKPETVTYVFDLRYLSGMNETYLVLKHAGSTVRDGATDDREWNYSPRALDQSLIDNPPET